MSYIGIDIGTTNISFASISDNAVLNYEIIKRNNSFISTESVHKLQDVDTILNIVKEGIDDIITHVKDPVKGIGICCQMHGIVYTLKGKAVSPLYTWMDESGNEQYMGGMTYSEYITFLTGYKVFSGYGACTHFYLQVNKKLPKKYDKIYPIGDYIAMKLTGSKQCRIHPTCAASFGLYDLFDNIFDQKALETLEIDNAVLPDIDNTCYFIGKEEHGIPVTNSVGDSQAAIYGSGATENELVMNFGTGGQISCVVKNVVEIDANSELRPFFENQFLYTASTLSAGASYDALNTFFKRTLKAFGVEKSTEEIYKVMDSFEKKPGMYPVVSPEFKGSRKDSKIRASITNLSYDNFSPEMLSIAFLNGIANELYPYYQQFKNVIDFTGIVITGNLARKCPLFMDVLKSIFKDPIRLSSVKSEASVGAAKVAIKASI